MIVAQSAAWGAGPGSTNFYLNVSASSICGVNTSAHKYITIGGGIGPIAEAPKIDEPFPILIYPNPSEGTRVYITSETKKPVSIQQVQIMDIATGRIVKKFECLDLKGSALDIDLPKGVFIIQYMYDNTRFTQKIMIK